MTLTFYIKTCFKVTVHPLTTSSLMLKSEQDWIKWKEVKVHQISEISGTPLPIDLKVTAQCTSITHKFYLNEVGAR